MLQARLDSSGKSATPWMMFTDAGEQEFARR
jgi:hypothetical protein